MALKVQCECGRSLRLPDDAVGKRGRCPACGTVFTVPGSEPEPEHEREPVARSAAAPIGIDRSDVAPPPADESTYDIREEPYEITAVRTAAVARQAREARKMAGFARPPRPVIPIPSGSTNRPYRYLLLLVTLLPLVWATFISEKPESVAARLEQTIEAHPEIQSKLDDDESHPLQKEELFAAIPEHKIIGALLPYDTRAHWGCAVLSGAVFFGLILLLFPPGHTKVWHLLLVGLFTGTLGILLLLGLQWTAFHIPLFHGSGILTLLLDIVWLIGLSYRMALGDYNVLLSALGFTAGVGFCEEACKAIPVIFKARTDGFVSWRSAMSWGLVSGVGFGVSEGITYSHDSYNGLLGGQIYLVRFISCVGLHGIWAAAVGISVYRRQDQFRGSLSALEWIWQTLITVIVPMCLHGMYDTLLKKDYNWAALAIALASFGWLSFQIGLSKRRLDTAPHGYAVT